MAEEVKNTSGAGAENPPKEDATPKAGDIINEAKPKEDKETVGLDKFLDLKKENKQLRRDMEDLAKRVEHGASRSDLADDIDSISKEYPDVDPAFIEKIVGAAEKRAEKKADEKISSQINANDSEKKIDEAFQKHFKVAMDRMPEYDGIVNQDVIKNLTLLKANADKTFSQIIEETYGNAITGKRTIDKTAPGGGKDPEPLDMKKAKDDPTYFKQVMKSPKLKAEYNEAMLKRF